MRGLGQCGACQSDLHRPPQALPQHISSHRHTNFFCETVAEPALRDVKIRRQCAQAQRAIELRSNGPQKLRNTWIERRLPALPLHQSGREQARRVRLFDRAAVAHESSQLSQCFRLSLKRLDAFAGAQRVLQFGELSALRLDVDDRRGSRHRSEFMRSIGRYVEANMVFPRLIASGAQTQRAVQTKAKLSGVMPMQSRIETRAQHEQSVRPEIKSNCGQGVDPVSASLFKPGHLRAQKLRIMLRTTTTLFRYATFPLMLLGFNAALIALIGSGAPLWQPFLVLFAAIGFMFAVERIIPFANEWNADHGDRARDLLHFVVNSTFNHLGVLFLPLFAAVAPFPNLWPSELPFWAQVIMAILVVDVGISAAHHASHHSNFLWRFHAVHHSVKRMYGFNGLMKHPIHQAIEAVSGFAPLLLTGVPGQVASAVAFCVAIQLLLQHSNADYRTGPLKYFFANAEVHRFHHRIGDADGNVNFGLFTTLWDHFAGTFHFQVGAAPSRSEDVGMLGAEQYPKDYLPQLVQPFREWLVGR